MLLIVKIGEDVMCHFQRKPSTNPLHYLRSQAMNIESLVSCVVCVNNSCLRYRQQDYFLIIFSLTNVRFEAVTISITFCLLVSSWQIGY